MSAVCELPLREPPSPARWLNLCANRPEDAAVGAVSSALAGCRVRAQKSACGRKTPPDHQRADAQMAPTSTPRWRTPLPSSSRPTSRAFVDKELLKCSLSPFAARPWHAPPASLDAASLCTCLVRCPKGLLRCVAAIYVVCKHAGGLVKWESTSGDRSAARGDQQRYFFVRLPTMDTPRPYRTAGVASGRLSGPESCTNTKRIYGASSL